MPAGRRRALGCGSAATADRTAVGDPSSGADAASRLPMRPTAPPRATVRSPPAVRTPEIASAGRGRPAPGRRLTGCHGSPDIGSWIPVADIGLRRRATDVEAEPADAPEIKPWDRRPLMIALAAADRAGPHRRADRHGERGVLQPGAGRVADRAAACAHHAGPRPVRGRVSPVGADDTITLSGVGDVIMGTLPRASSRRTTVKGFFDPVKAALAADLVMGNLETPLTADTGNAQVRASRPGESTTASSSICRPSYANHLSDGGLRPGEPGQQPHQRHGPSRAAQHPGTRSTRPACKHTGAPGRSPTSTSRASRSPFSGSRRSRLGAQPLEHPGGGGAGRAGRREADLVVIQMQGGAEGADKSHVRPGPECFLRRRTAGDLKVHATP